MSWFAWLRARPVVLLGVAVLAAILLVAGGVYAFGGDDAADEGPDQTNPTASATPLGSAKPSTSSASPTPEDVSPAANNPLGLSGWYRISSRKSSLCLDADGGSSADGTRLQQWTCGTDKENQQWRFVPVGDGYYRVVSKVGPSGNWSVEGGPPAVSDGARIHLWQYADGTNDQWKPIRVGTGVVKFEVKNSQKCLDVPNGSTARGTQLQQWSCVETDNQVFLLTRP